MSKSDPFGARKRVPGVFGILDMYPAGRPPGAGTGRARQDPDDGEGPAREPAPLAGDRSSPPRTTSRSSRCGARSLSRTASSRSSPSRVHPAGLHRRPGRGRPRRHALGDRARGRRRRRRSTRSSRSTSSSTTRSRSTRSARATAFERNVEREYERNHERYSLLRWAQQAFAGFRVVPPGHGDRAPGEPRAPREGRADARDDGDGRDPRHARRHRLAHADDQRAGRSGLGRRRDRGRGRHAGTAAAAGDAEGRRLPVHRRAADRRHRDRPRPDGHRDAAQARRRREVRRVLRRGPVEPDRRRPRNALEHVAGVRRHRVAVPRSTTRPSTTCA